MTKSLISKLLREVNFPMKEHIIKSMYSEGNIKLPSNKFFRLVYRKRFFVIMDLSNNKMFPPLVCSNAQRLADLLDTHFPNNTIINLINESKAWDSPVLFQKLFDALSKNIEDK